MTEQTTGARTGRPADEPYSYCMALYAVTAKLHEAHTLMDKITGRMITERGLKTPEDQLPAQMALTALCSRIIELAEAERFAEAEAGAALLAQLADDDDAAAAAAYENAEDKRLVWCENVNAPAHGNGIHPQMANCRNPRPATADGENDDTCPGGC